jgi:hypothetical protein
LVVTDRKVDGNETPNNFEAFQESERARKIKNHLEVAGDAEFVFQTRTATNRRWNARRASCDTRAGPFGYLIE